MSLQVGQLAPNFVSIGVYNNRLGKIRLSDYYGKKYIILVFYPANFITISLTELIELDRKIAEFKKLSTQVLAISGDSPFSHLQSLLIKRAKGGLGQLHYPLISDLNHELAIKYKLFMKDGFTLPGLFIIDKEGIIQYHMVNNLLCGRNINELIRILQSIQYVKKNPGKLCPANWKHGDETLQSYPLKSKN